MDVSEWLFRPSVEEVVERVGSGGVIYGEGEKSFPLGFSGEVEVGDCGESGESTGDGSSSRMEIKDGEDCGLGSTIIEMRCECVAAVSP